MLKIIMALAAFCATCAMAVAAPERGAQPDSPPQITVIDAAAAGQDALRKRIDDLRAAITSPDRALRIAAFQTAVSGSEPALRRLAVEAALDSRDPVLGNLALRDWLSRQRVAPVLLYATKEDAGSVLVLRNLGPLTLKLESFDPASGAVTANLGAPGYDVTRASVAVGTLAQTTLTLNAYGCQLALQLTEHRTLDGQYRCQSLPVLVARVVVD